MKKAKVSFCCEMSISISNLMFELKRPDLGFPDHIGGQYYFSLSDKEKKKYRLMNPQNVLKHSDYQRVFNLTIDEQV